MSSASVLVRCSASLPLPPTAVDQTRVSWALHAHHAVALVVRCVLFAMVAQCQPHELRLGQAELLENLRAQTEA